MMARVNLGMAAGLVVAFAKELPAGSAGPASRRLLRVGG
jgi:hypothetical protein